MLGPRTDWFPEAAVALLLEQDWEVTPQSSRVGIRLRGQPLVRTDARELPSEGTERGAIQVPHSGQPVLFLADHPLTGGYPVIATVLPEALALAGQIPPGARIRFSATRPFSPIEPAP
jgi:allophanate hydrolase subunit 2